MAEKYIVSLKDIARETGVSVSTVSRVIKKKGEIAGDTRQRVMLAATRLGYHDNRLIEGIKTGRTRVIGVMVPINDNYFNQIVLALQRLLQARGYLSINTWMEPDGCNEREMLQRLLEQRVEGIIIRPVKDWADDDYFYDVIKRGLPIVALDRKIPAHIDFIGTDDFEVGRMAAEYLYRRGHRHIACFQGPQQMSPGQLRRVGFEEFIRHADGTTPYIVGAGGWQNDSAEVVAAFLEANPQVSAIQTFNDDYAAIVYEAIRLLGKTIPDDLAVIGCGEQLRGRYLHPELTSISQDPETIARELVEQLFLQLQSPPGYVHQFKEIRIKPSIVNRQSS